IEVSVARLPYTLDGFTIERVIDGEDTVLFAVDAGETIHDDTTAPAPELLAPSAPSATDGLVLGRVEFTSTIPRPLPGEPAHYRIRQRYTEGVSSDDSPAVTGHRDVEVVTTTLYRGASEGLLETVIVDASQPIATFDAGPFAWHGEDTDATPVFPVRHYTLVLSAQGLSSVQTTSTSGFPGAIPEVSLGTVVITGHTTANLHGTHVDVAPEPGAVRGCWRLQGEAVFQCGAVSTVDPGALSVPLAGLPAGRYIDFQLRSENIHGEGTSAVLTALTPPSAPASFQAGQGNDHQHVTLAWQHNADQVVDTYRIYRGGEFLQAVPGTGTSFNDAGAPAGTVGAPTNIGTSGAPDVVHVSWTNPAPQPGASSTYQVIAVNASGTGASPERSGWRGAPTITAIEVDTSAGIEAIAGDPIPQSFADSNAGAPSLQAGTLSASQGTHASHVTLNASGFSTSPGASRTYRVRVLTNAGASPWSESAIGSRTPGPLEVRFEFDQGGGSFALVRNYATATHHNDSTAPADGSPRTYRALVRAAGTGTLTSNSAVGYRFPPLDLGENCSANWQCFSGLCSSFWGTCRLPVMAACDPQDPDGNLCWTEYCDDSAEVCQMVPSGFPCSFDDQCQGAWCWDGFCY
ncbi:MAG: hypothetical protein EA398_03160, partial [Deltaproteobacteria bacterium]